MEHSARLLMCLVLAGFSASAAVVAVGPGAFPGGSTLIDFDGYADFTEVNGLVDSGVTFSYLVGGNPLNGAVILDGGPGVTNNITPQNIVSIGDPSGILRMSLSTQATMVGYGYAILNTVPVIGATTISLYDGATFLSSLSYDGVPDPVFTGGFAGIQSDVAFNRVDITFNSAVAPAFALDNILIAGGPDTVIPEPATLLLTLVGGAMLLGWRRRSAA